MDARKRHLPNSPLPSLDEFIIPIHEGQGNSHTHAVAAQIAKALQAKAAQEKSGSTKQPQDGKK